MAWFKDWFNSPYYHILYAHRSEEEAAAFIEKLCKHLQIPVGANVLDVACGKGRHSKTLARLGYNVTGIDLAQNSINEARQHTCNNLHFDIWDMRQTYKSGHFDVVVNLFSSFGYFDTYEEDIAAIQAMYNNLKPGGWLVIDYINTQCAITNLKPREIIQRGETQFHISKKVENGFIKKQISFLADGENHEFEEKLKVINLITFEGMLKQTGFTLKEVLGDYSLQPFDARRSPRLILVAQKT